MISGWWKIDSDSSQPESIKLTSPPRPVSLPVSADIWSRNSVPVVVTVKVTQRESGTWPVAEEHVGIAELRTPLRQALPQRPDRPARCCGGASVIDPTDMSAACDPKVSSTMILRRDGDRGRRAVPFVVEPVDGYAAGRRREADVPDEGAGLKIHAARAQPGDQRFDERLVLVDRRAPDVRHVRKVGKQVQGAVQVAPQLRRAVLRQRPHDRRIDQPEFGREEPRGKELLDAAPVQLRFWRQREPREVETVAPAQAETRAVHDAAVAIDEVAPGLSNG